MHSISHFNTGSHLSHRHKNCVPWFHSRFSFGQCKDLRVPCVQPLEWWRPCCQLFLSPRCLMDAAGCLQNVSKWNDKLWISKRLTHLIHRTHHLWTSWRPGRAAELRWRHTARWGHHPPSPMLVGRLRQTGLLAQASYLWERGDGGGGGEGG